MQDLTQKYLAVANLVPTSQSEGGEVHDNHLAMTAPGSQPVSVPMPDEQLQEKLPLAVDVIKNTPVIPVSDAPGKPRPAAAGSTGSWTTTFEAPGTWKEL